MSAHPSNPKPNGNPVLPDVEGATYSSGRTSDTQAPGFEALQALLAFSSLQEQIRQRRAVERGEATEAPPSWTAEPFIFDEVLQLVAERALAITGSDGIAIALSEGSEVVCRASAGESAPPHGARLDPNSGFSASCLRTGQIVRCDDSESDPRVDVEVCRRLGTRSMVALPLRERDRVVGLIEAFSGIPYGFNDGDIRSLNLLAELVLAAMKPEDPLARTVLSLAHEAEPPKPEVAQAEPGPMPSVEELQSALQVHKAEASFYDATHDEKPTILAEYENPKKLPPGLIIVLIILALALLTGAGVWLKLRRGNTAATPSTATTPAVSTQSATPADVDREEPKVPAASSTPGSHLTGIRHWSSSDSSTVVIDLQDHVQYEAHRLTDPERIYFDLHDTAIADDIATDFEIQDALLVRVRVAQPKDGVTRVVLETKGSPNFSVSLEQSPYRLVVEVHPVGTAPRPRAQVNLFGPMNPEESASLNGAVRPDARHAARAGKFRIALDAGHGGWDLGTVGRSGLQEKELVLDIVARLGQLLEDHLGAEVIYTREDDKYISLERRTELANLSQADLFVSVHANYSDLTSAQGIETYYTNTYSSVRARTKDTGASSPLDVDWTNVDVREKVLQSKRLASEVQRALFRTLSEDNPTLRNRGVKKASYVVLTGTTMPAVLAEVSFVSSPSDEAHLRTPGYRQQIAEAIFKGVSGFKAETHPVTLAKNSARSIGR
jgi:N-acetylmuramoyl-L-alanine amidase